MILAGTVLLYPTVRSTQSLPVEDGAKLAGLAYDFRRACLWVGANPAHCVYGLSTSTGLIQRRLHLADTVTEILDLACQDNLLYVLHHVGDGALEILVGPIPEDVEDGIFEPSVYPLPYYVESDLSQAEVWTLTHDPELAYMKFHPRYTSLFNVGESLYMALGLSQNITDHYPKELGQWLVSYDLLGLIGSRESLDASPAFNERLATKDALNGLGLAATYVDGNVLLLCETFGSPGHLKILTPTSSIWTGLDWVSSAVDNSEFVSMTSDARYIYIATDTMIYKSRAQFLVVYVSNFDIYSPCVDAGTVAIGQTLTRKLKLKNMSTTHKYDRIILTSSDNELTLSVDDQTYSEQLTLNLTSPLGPSMELEFYARIAPIDTRQEQMQIVNSIHIKGRECA